MIHLLLNTLALDPHRWTPDKIAAYRLEVLLPRIAEAGFEGIELWQYHITREPEAEVVRLRALAEACGVTVPVVGLYPALHHQGAARQNAWEQVPRGVDYAALLGAHAIKIFVGNKGTTAHTEAEYERALTFLADLAVLIGSQGMILTGEAHPDTLFDAPEACLRVLAAVDNEHLKICFQSYDFVDTAQTLADYERLSDHVIHVHYQGRQGGTLALLEEADLDYEALTRALVAWGFEGYLSLELVKASVVEAPTPFDLDQVLRYAQQDRNFVRRVLEG